MERAAVLAPMEASEEEGRRDGEGQLRCGMLQGGGALLYGLGEGLGRWGGVVEWPESWRRR
jgi:hypothetical protein